MTDPKQGAILPCIPETVKANSVAGGRVPNFLQFLLSGEKDIDVFGESRRKKRPSPVIQTHPEGVRLPRPSRSQTWDKESLKDET